MNLHFTKLGNGEPILIVHGLFGSSDNWRTLGKKFSEKNTVYLIDLRNHGRSDHSDEMNYEIMADDLMNFINKENIVQPILLGHSMGGKTALMFVKKFPNISIGAIPEIDSFDEITFIKYSGYIRYLSFEILKINAFEFRISK